LLQKQEKDIPMKFWIYALSACALTASLGGCATVTRGTTTRFKVTSIPPGAAVKTSTGFSCEATPCSMKMPRKEEFDVTVTKTGYVAHTQHVRSVVGGAGAAGVAGNVVAGGLIGIVIDGTNGSMNDLRPNPLSVALEAAPDAAVVAASAEAGPPPNAPAPPTQTAASVTPAAPTQAPKP
jgi:hypothetical protein